MGSVKFNVRTKLREPKRPQRLIYYYINNILLYKSEKSMWTKYQYCISAFLKLCVPTHWWIAEGPIKSTKHKTLDDFLSNN